LHIAAQDGIPEITQLLLDFGANPNVLDEMGGTPAQWAVRNNHVEVIRVLLEGGLDPNLDKGHSLRLALSLGRLRIARLFFRHGAKVDESIIYAAKESSNYKGNRIPFFKLCAENMNSDEEAGSTEDSVTIGGDVQVSIRLTGLTLPTLMNGIEGRSDDFRLAAVLFEYGLEKGLRDLEDIPRALLICICAEYGFERGISRLLELGNISTAIRRHSVRPFKWTALHVAIWFGHTALVEILHANGWSLTQEDSKGRSIVELAASQGHVELVQKLLAAHCSAEHRDQDGHTPLHFAVSGPGGDNALLLECLHVAGCNVRKASVSGETALHQAAQLNHSTAAAWLLGKGALVGATDRFSNTPLHFAAYYNAVRVVEILLSYNADVNQTAVDGRTPLHCASQAGADDAIPALLGAGADPNKTDSKGRTALTTAIFFSACEPSTVDTLFACTTVDWMAKRGAQPVVTAALAARSENRAAILANVLYTLRKAMGEAKAQRIVQRLMPELVPEMLVSADDSDRGSLTDLIPLLLEFLPKNARTRNVMLFHMLLAAIKYGGDDDGHLTRQLLLLDESNVTQVSRGNWGLQHLCCKYGRLKQLRVFLAFGLSPYSRVDIDGVSHQPLDVAKMFSPEMVGPLETLIKNMSILGNLCRSDRTISPLLRSAVGMAHSEREIVDLSVAFKQDVITHRQ
jgi:ankyrin repeat protein